MSSVDGRTVLATFLMPFGEWTITLDELADTITIKRRSNRYGKTGLCRLLLVDGGEVGTETVDLRVTDNPREQR